MMSSDKLIAKNPTAFHNYNIENKLEAGIVLSGTEIKSIKFSKAKAQPNADLTISAQEISDFSLTWDILVDDQDLILEIDKKVGQ